MENPEAPAVPQIITVSAPSSSGWVKPVLIGIGGLLLVKVIKDQYQNYQTNKEANKVDTDPAANAAQQLHEVIGTGWGTRYIGTNDEKVLTILKQVADYNALEKSYTNLAHSNLWEDLRKGMKEANYIKALNLVGDKKGLTKPTSQAAQTTSTANQVQYVIATADVRIRKTPVVKAAFSFQNNIIATVPAGTFIGITDPRRKIAYDPAEPAYFLPILIQLSTGHMVDAWVTPSAVKVLKNKPSQSARFYSVTAYAMAKAPLEGVDRNEAIRRLCA